MNEETDKLLDRKTLYEEVWIKDMNTAIRKSATQGQ